MSKSTVVMLALMLAACGGKSGLDPAPGKTLPVKPAGAATTPTAAQLMTPSEQSRPVRSDELLTKSQQRPVDRFDLPPPG